MNKEIYNINVVFFFSFSHKQTHLIEEKKLLEIDNAKKECRSLLLPIGAVHKTFTIHLKNLY